MIAYYTFARLFSIHPEIRRSDDDSYERVILTGGDMVRISAT